MDDCIEKLDTVITKLVLYYYCTYIVPVWYLFIIYVHKNSGNNSKK
jgi:hypothetical protein